MSQTYTEEFKLSAVQLALREDKQIAAVARELNINSNTLHTWVSKYRSTVSAGGSQEEAANTAHLLEQLKQLRKENTRLKEERAILVKAAAFFAKESESGTNS
jgi:transposase